MNDTDVQNWMRSSAEGGPTAVVATSGPESLAGAAKILSDGGSATDAVLSAALAQIVLCAGSWVSFAGILSFIHYEAASGQVTSLNGGFNTVLAETDPLSIPRFGKRSGRSVLVPGFPAALFSAHSRFGRVTVDRVFEHAVHLASAGITVDPTLAVLLRKRRNVLTRSESGRAVFLNSDGRLAAAGERLVQHQLEETFRAAVHHGPDYFYRGAWANRLVAAVRGEGGRITAADLSAYEPLWTEPVRARLSPAEVFAPGSPGYGGMYLVEALHLADAAGLGRRSLSAEDRLFWLIQITHARYIAEFLDPGQRIERPVASALWQQIERLGRFQLIEVIAIMNRRLHSDGVVAIDGYGNVAALCHSINTLYWGSTGIFVDGVSIPDAASHQQHAIARVRPGARLPDDTNPAIALRNGRPVLACTAIGASLHELTVESLVDVLLRGKALEDLRDEPMFLSPHWGGLYHLGRLQGRVLGAVADALFSIALRILSFSDRLVRRAVDVAVRVPAGAFPQPVMREWIRKGQPVVTVTSDAAPSMWAALGFDQQRTEAVACVRSSARRFDGRVD